MKALIIGGTRFLGPKIIEGLTAAGHDVHIFNRGNDYGYTVPETVTVLTGDRNNPADLVQLGAEAYDYIYDMTCYDKPQATSLVAAIQPSAHIVFLSTAAVYEKPLLYPLDESSKLGAWDSFGRYGTDKVEAENVFIAYGEQHNKKVTILRPVYLLGDNNYFDRENYYFSRIYAGQPILVPGNGQALMQFAFAGETADALIRVPFTQEPAVEILNIGGNEYISTIGLINLCADIAGKPAVIRKIGDKLADIEEDQFYDDLYPFPNLNFILSGDKATRKYGVTYTPLRPGLEAIHANWKNSWDGEVRTYEKEQEVLQRLDDYDRNHA